jgi:RimJ/RimL family protein N-acetyltransferase
MIRFKYLYKDDISWSDTEFLRNTRSHPVTLANVFHQKKITRIEQEEWFIDVYSSNSDYHIWLAYDDKWSIPVGYIQMWVDSILHRRAQLYWVPSPEHVSIANYVNLIRGSLKQLVKLEMDIHKIWSYVLTENVVLIESLDKTGFEIDAILRDHVYTKDGYKDAMIVSRIVDINL